MHLLDSRLKSGGRRSVYKAMQLWPCDSFEIQTRLTEEDVKESLRSHVEPKQWLRFSFDHKKFQGEVANHEFKISRIIHYRNSFLPVIHGMYRPCPAGTIISIYLELHPFVKAFLCVWFGVVTLGMFGGLGALLRGGIQQLPAVLIPGVMLLVGWGMTSMFFWVEARKQKPMLFKMFKAN
jgi:hypothetical protein